MKPIIPDAALGQHIAVLGKTGSGKTFAAKASIVEPLLERQAHVGIVDPTDAWWGLRSSRDGKGPGYAVLVLGGNHGDLPLPANGGGAVARLLIEQRINLVACTKHLTVGERTRWAIDFFGTINRLNRRPMHLLVDEAHNFAPQGKVPDPDTGKMLHAVNSLASEGRSKGIRFTMLTQRPQKLHKDTLTCAETLVAMRVLAPHDREAVEDWVKGCGDREHGKEVLNSLASLKRGEGWVWYPEGRHLVRGRFPEIRTFDSSATPEEGREVKAPKAAAELDLTEIKAALAEAVKEAEANDPKLLRAEIARLKAELARKPSAASAKVDHAAISQAQVTGRMAGRDDVLDRVAFVHGPLKTAADALDAAVAALKKASELEPPAPVQTSAQRPKAAPRAGELSQTGPATTATRKDGHATAAAGLTRAERQLLIVLAQRHPKAATRSQMSILSGYSGNSSTFDNALSGLRANGYSQGYGNDNRITGAGLQALGTYEPLPTGEQLVTYWLGKLYRAERKFLEYIVGRYPHTVSKEELAGETGYSTNSSTFDNALSKLRTLELIERGEIKASEELFGG